MAEINWIEVAMITAGFVFLIMLAATAGIAIMLKVLEKMKWW